MKPSDKRKNAYSTRRILSILLVFVALVLISLATLKAIRFMHQTGLTPQFLVQLLTGSDTVLTRSNGKVAVLFLGVSGGEHAGSDLTDTMLVVSVDPATSIIRTISIPRDVWSDTLKDKVNTAYHYGEEKKQGGGFTLAKVVAEDIIGFSIPYAVKIDFSGFVKIIDAIGGIDILVPASFTDEQYPILEKEHDSCPNDPQNRCLYETVVFEKGMQHMDGNTALKYVRSRHAEGPDGNDFSRNRRQQDVIIAVRNKLLHPAEWITRKSISAMRELASNYIDSDMNTDEAIAIGYRLLRMKQAKIVKISFEDKLINPPVDMYGGRYVLVPAESWSEIQSTITNDMDSH